MELSLLEKERESVIKHREGLYVLDPFLVGLYVVA